MSDISMEMLFGGVHTIGHPLRTEMDLYEISRIGLPKKALLNLVANLDFSIRGMAHLLNITERTIQRKKDQDLLDLATTEQLLQIAEVYSRGIAVFDSAQEFQTWMQAANIALDGKPPLELLASRYGAQMVLELVGRIEQGVFS